MGSVAGHLMGGRQGIPGMQIGFEGMQMVAQGVHMGLQGAPVPNVPMGTMPVPEQVGNWFGRVPSPAHGLPPPNELCPASSSPTLCSPPHRRLRRHAWSSSTP